MKRGGWYADVLSVGDVVTYFDVVQRRWWQFWLPKIEVVAVRIRIDSVMTEGAGRGCFAFGDIVPANGAGGGEAVA